MKKKLIPGNVIRFNAIQKLPPHIKGDSGGCCITFQDRSGIVLAILLSVCDLGIRRLFNNL